MSVDDQTAREVAQRLLEATGGSMFSGDFRTFRDCFVLPQEMRTFEGQRIIKTEADLRELFDAMRALYRRKNITEVVRHCVEAEFLDDDTVSSTHEARLLAGTVLYQRPYPVHSILKRDAGRWRIARSEYAISDNPDMEKIFLGMTSEKDDC